MVGSEKRGEELEKDLNITRCAGCKQSEMIESSQLPPLCNLVVQRFQGETCEGLPSGEGVAYFEGGHQYKGTFSKGLMDGHGVFTWADGLKYEGNFACNTLMGQGMYTWPDGSTYRGEVNYGIRHGTGTHCCAKSGVLYNGQWHQGKRQGKGTVYYNQDKTDWYKGEWLQNKIEGCGVRCYISGNIYTGEWKNNMRHGEGTMKWLQSGQQYEGTWHNGQQHGNGTHIWILKRQDGSQYSRSNKYVGEFVYGKRHGQGTFYYADGAVYEGQWSDNNKHGQGTFTYKNGRVFQGKFVEDQMIQLRNDTPPSLLGLFYQSSILAPDMTLNIDQLLKDIPEKRRDTELKEVELAVLRHSSELRSIYSFYSRLGQSQSLDNTFMMTRLQLWRLLKDCNIHHHSISLIKIDLLTREGATSAEVHSPFTGLLFRQLLTCLVVAAYYIYQKDMTSERDLLAGCFSKMMTNNILPSAKTVKGLLFRQHEHTEVAMQYFQRSLEVYQASCTLKAASRDDITMTYRDLMLMFKDFHLFDNTFSAGKFIDIITVDALDTSTLSSCLDVEITFLEFFETLLGCAEVRGQLDSDNTDETKSSPESNTTKESDHSIHTKSSSPAVTTPVNTPTVFQDSRPQSEVRASRDRHDSSSTHHIEILVDSLHLPEHALDHDDEKPKQEEPKENQLELWTQRLHDFFDHVFFTAFEQHQLVKKYMKKHSISLKTQARIALSKTRQKAL